MDGPPDTLAGDESVSARTKQSGVLEFNACTHLVNEEPSSERRSSAVCASKVNEQEPQVEGPRAASWDELDAR